jgi:hypothetical protein
MTGNPYGICLNDNCEDEHDLPSTGEMAKNLFDTGKDILMGVVAGEGVMVDEAVKLARLDTCHACEFFIRDSERCSKCGCFMKTKTAFKKATCPIGKW